MPARLHQLHVEYAPAEDRVLLKLNTTDRKELRLWLTRRVVKGFWDMLQQLLIATGSAARQSDPSMRKAIVAFEQATALHKDSFISPFAENAAEFPLGTAPVVLSGVSFAAPAKRGGLGRLDFRTVAGHEIGIPAAANVLHSFAKMLESVNEHTGWDLRLDVGYRIGESRTDRGRVH
jgi:hypothetical protein